MYDQKAKKSKCIVRKMFSDAAFLMKHMSRALKLLHVKVQKKIKGIFDMIAMETCSSYP